MGYYRQKRNNNRRNTRRPNDADIAELGFLLGVDDIDNNNNTRNDNNNNNRNMNQLIFDDYDNEESKCSNHNFSLYKGRSKSQSLSGTLTPRELGIRYLQKAKEDNFSKLHDYSVIKITLDGRATCDICIALGNQTEWGVDKYGQIRNGAKIHYKDVFQRHSLSVSHNPWIRPCKDACMKNNLDYTTLGVASYFEKVYNWGLGYAIQRCVVEPREELLRQIRAGDQIQIPSIVSLLTPPFHATDSESAETIIDNGNQSYLFDAQTQLKNKIDLVNTIVQNDIPNRHYTTISALMARCDARRNIVWLSNKNSKTSFNNICNSINNHSIDIKNNWLKTNAISLNIIIDCNTKNGYPIMTIKMRGIDKHFNTIRFLGSMEDLRKTDSSDTIQDRQTYETTDDLLRIIKDYVARNGIDLYKTHGITIDGAERSLGRALQSTFNEHALIISKC